MSEVLAGTGATEIPQPRTTEATEASGLCAEVRACWPEMLDVRRDAAWFWDVRVCAWRRCDEAGDA